MPEIELFMLSAVAFLIPFIAIYVPLAMAPLFVVSALYPGYLFIKKGQLMSLWNDSRVNKILVISLAYALLSSLWAIEPKETIHLWGRMVMFFIAYMALFAYAAEITFKDKIFKSLFYGIICILVIVNIEIFTDGAISKLFGVVYKVSKKFELVIFNRGASVLSIMSWPVVCYLFAQKKYKIAAGFLLAVFFTIARLDSLSSVLGLVLGCVIFALVYFKGPKFLKILAVIAVCGVFIVALAAELLDSHKAVGEVPVIPGAASNMRLYIWDYTAKQAYKKPLLGWGFNSSRSYPVEKKDYVDGGRSPLPLHPHNNVLQIWLEMGAVGLALFAAFLAATLWQIAEMKTEPYVVAAFAAMFCDYFMMGETGYGIWQNWWVATAILAAFFLQMEKKTVRT